MSEYLSFGDSTRFEIAFRFVPDPEPRNRLPEHGGWSMGDLRLTVGGLCLTQHGLGEENRSALRWYLLPVFEWLAASWDSLLHEERFAWPENSPAPAAMATFYALRALMTATHVEAEAKCDLAQEWRRRHALRAADSSALLPDVFFRRLANDIEISWTARKPTFAPDGFRLELSPGVATLSVEDVAGPLWKALTAFCYHCPPDLTDDDRQSVHRLRKVLDFKREQKASDFESRYLPATVMDRLEKMGRMVTHQSFVMPGIPAISYFGDQVLMYGGVSPNIGRDDFQTLAQFLSDSGGKTEAEALSDIVNTSIGSPGQTPYEEGYDLADDILEKLDIHEDASFVDIYTILRKLEIHIEEKVLKTDSIRGVAIAGDGYRPSIFINETSNYNRSEEGRRFTLAHEFCHILFDRSRAKRIAHTSGAWAQPGVEKRANAFAAMFLMPRDAVRRCINDKDPDIQVVERVAEQLRVGISALIEHLYNMNMIDEWRRDTLRGQVAGPQRR